MKRIKRILAFMLTLIILLTLCDWSVFTSLAANMVKTVNNLDGTSSEDITVNYSSEIGSDESEILSFVNKNIFIEKDDLRLSNLSNVSRTDIHVNESVLKIIKSIAEMNNVSIRNNLGTEFKNLDKDEIINTWSALLYMMNVKKNDGTDYELKSTISNSTAIQNIHDNFDNAISLYTYTYLNGQYENNTITTAYVLPGLSSNNFVYVTLTMNKESGFSYFDSWGKNGVVFTCNFSVVTRDYLVVPDGIDEIDIANAIASIFNAGYKGISNENKKDFSCPSYIEDNYVLVHTKYDANDYKSGAYNDEYGKNGETNLGVRFTVGYRYVYCKKIGSDKGSIAYDITSKSSFDMATPTGNISDALENQLYFSLDTCFLNPVWADFVNNTDYLNADNMGADGTPVYNNIATDILAKITSEIASNYLNSKRDDLPYYSVSGMYAEIESLIKDILDARLEQYASVINGSAIAEDFINSGKELPADSLEYIIAMYTYAKLLSEQGKSDYENNLSTITNYKVFKFSLKNENGKKYAIVTTGDLVSDCPFASEFNKYSDEYEFYAAKDIFSKTSTLFQNIITTEYFSERNRLKITTTSANMYKTKKWSKANDSTDGIGLWLYDKKSTDGSTEPVKGGAIASAIAKEISTCNEDNVNVSTILEYISYTYENGLYLTYNGLFGNGTSSDSSEWNVYNAGLNKLQDLSFSEIEDCTYVADTLPARIGAFGEDGYKWFDNSDMQAKDSSWYRFVQFLHNTAMGFEIANGLQSETFTKVDKFTGNNVNTTWGYSIEHIEELLEQWNNPNPDEETFNDDSKVAPEMIQAILGLHDFMDALDIDKNDWTPTIAGYYDLYDDLKKFANNPLIKRDVVAAAVPTVEEPMAPFFSIQDNSMTDYWTIGFSLSSTYVPFETNMYDASSVAFTNDTKWISDFYYKYGFYRKALMINTDASAITNEELTGKKSGTRVATLKDLVYPAGDVILTIDDDFYNAEKVQESVDRVDYTTIRGTTPQATGEDSADEDIIKNAADKLGAAIEGSLDLDAETILKTDGQAYYSSTLATNCTHLEASEGLDIAAYFADAYLLDKESIFDALDDDEYSAKQSFAVVSAIYRSADLYNLVLKSLGNSNELFKASKGVANIASCDEDSYMYYMNYLMLEGLERQMKNTSSNQLDLNAPIFCDIFGNIVTESGDIIIPASANTTLAGENWTPVNIGFATLVGGKFFEVGNASEDFKEWITGATFDDKGRITKEASTKYKDHTKGAGWFTLATDGFCLMPCMVSDGANQMILNWSAIPVNGDNLKNLVYNVAYNTVSKDSYNSTVINLVIETLRGAPIENIDYAKEGLSTGTDMSRFGVYAAFKLEDILNSVYSDETTNNSMLNYKNLVFVSGIEYIVLYVYKVMFAIMIVSLFIHIYADATKNQIGFKSAISFVSTIACVIFCVTLIPQLISWSYYNANKSLLSDNMGYLVLLNYVKELDGKEINVASLDKPSTTTETYIKLEDIKFDWFEATSDVLFKNTFKTVSEIYENEIKGSALANAAGVIREGDCLYYPISEMLDNADIAYNTNTKTLSLRTYSDSSAASYISPFYVILRQLVSNVNAFNMDNNVVAMSVETSGGDEAGQILTYDLSTQYLISDLFVAEGYDITGMHKILQDESDKLSYAVTPFSSSDIERCSQSFWYPEDMPNEKRKEIVNDLEDYARAWVGKNADIFGKVPDEALLKVFALQLAIKFNQLVGCPYGDAIEIINLDSRDLFRLMISTKDNTYKYFSYGLARYTYETGNVIGCICMIAFVLLDKVVGSAKTIAMIIIIGLLITNVIFRKLLFRKNSQCFEGYLITCGGIIAVNYLYSLSLAIQMQLAGWGLSTWMCIFFGIFVQIAYVACLIGLVFITMKDWQNNGYEVYTEIGSNVMVNINNMRTSMQERMLRRRNSAYAQSGAKYEAPNRNGNDMLDDMFKRDSKRARAAQGPDEAPGNSSSKYVVVSKESLEESLEDYDRF